MSSVPLSLDYVAAPIPLVGMTADALDSLFRFGPAQAQASDSLSGALSPRNAENQSSFIGPLRGNRRPVLRQALSKEEGEGYWEFQHFSNDVAISWTRALYAKDTWIDVPGPSAAFKIRLLSNGELSHPDSHLHMCGPASVLSIYPVHTNNGYIVRGGIETEFVVLHCRPSLLTRYLGAFTEDLPMPFKRLNEPGGRSLSQFMPSMPNVQGIIRDLFQSRNRYSPAIQQLYLESKIQEILCNVVQNLVNQHAGTRTQGGLLQSPDVRRVREAQQILSQDVVTPPCIAELAHQIRSSQTKLKADFKAVTGETIYSFVKRRRMEKAAQLLLEGTSSISDIAYAVGYEYSANFSSVFRQYFGISPRKWLLLRSNRH